MLAALGAAWFVGAVAWPIWHTRAVVRAVAADTGGALSLAAEGTILGVGGVWKLGGPETAARRLAAYVRLPTWLAAESGCALMMLRACGKPGNTQLLKLLGGGDPALSRQAALTLGWIGERPRRDLFWGGLFADQDVRDLVEATAPGLDEVSDPYVLERLLDALASDDRDVRGVAAVALGMGGGSRAVSSLGRVLGGDPDAFVRYAAAWALGRIGDRAALEALAPALRDRGWGVSSMAAWALGRAGGEDAIPVLAAAVRDPGCGSMLHSTVYEVLGDLGAPAVEVLIADMGGDHPRADYLPPVAAGKALTRIGRPAVKPLVGLLAHPSHFVRCRIVRVLGEIGDPSAFPALRAALEDQNPEVREEAREAIMKFHGSGLDPWR
jgi:hypothetical protein